jgi:hypothetical protein
MDVEPDAQFRIELNAFPAAKLTNERSKAGELLRGVHCQRPLGRSSGPARSGPPARDTSSSVFAVRPLVRSLIVQASARG